MTAEDKNKTFINYKFAYTQSFKQQLYSLLHSKIYLQIMSIDRIIIIVVVDCAYACVQT